MRIRTIAAAVLGILAASTAAAQDLIVGRDSSRVEARVEEIGPREVRYKRFSNLGGPTYVMPVERIAYIVYPNGESDRFEAPADPQVPAAVSAAVTDAVVPAAVVPAAVVPAAVPNAVPVPQAPTPADPPIVAAAPVPAATQVPSAASGAVLNDVYVRKFRPGDYFESGDVRGVVFAVSDDGFHGLLLSLEEAEHYTPWSTLRERAEAVGADDNSDGVRNMEAVARYIERTGASWDDFPAFKWCRELGEGWYLPSIDELLRLAYDFNGGQRIVYDRKARTVFNETIKEHDGKRIDRMVDYFSSTEADGVRAKSAHMAVEPPYVNTTEKHRKFLVRAVRRF